MNRLKDKDRSRGYTLLVEAVVAFALFLVAAIAFYGTMANARRAELKARQIVAATAYARELLESRRAQGYDDLALGEESGQVSLDTIRDGTNGVINLEYRIEVSEVPPGGLKSVAVFLNWKDGQLDLEGYVGP